MAQTKKVFKPIILHTDLPALDPVVVQAQNVVTARHVAFDDFLKLFDDDIHGPIRGLAIKEGVTHLICMENLDFCSSQLGKRTAMAAGNPTAQALGRQTLAELLGTAFLRLGDVPSRFQYPVAYTSTAELRKATNTEPRKESLAHAVPGGEAAAAETAAAALVAHPAPGS